MTDLTAAPQVAALCDSLRDTDPLVRVYAAINLGLSAEAAEDAVAALTRALDDPDATVRKAAVIGLGSRGGLEAVAALMQALDDPHTGVREMAAETLLRFVEDSSDRRAA